MAQKIIDDDVKEKIKHTLRVVAKGRKTIFYNELAEKYGFNMDDSYSRDEFYAYIEKVGQDEVNDKRPPLNALVIKVDTKRPGVGFFTWYAKVDEENRDAETLMADDSFYEKKRADCWKEWYNKKV